MQDALWSFISQSLIISCNQCLSGRGWFNYGHIIFGYAIFSLVRMRITAIFELANYIYQICAAKKENTLMCMHANIPNNDMSKTA